ncbi:MAG TPA: enoyl-ACP reductase [Ktedonobacterales bacterium]|jgi:enoyl-[acyl-carrier protein] reductase I|nr:enoyl-ACP reductase [Ktedonobacterales bacterium]
MLDGKTALIFGVANHNSIAWAIAQKLAAEGARLAFTYQERMEQNVRKLTADMPGTLVLPCDVQRDDELDAAFERVGKEFGGLDILIHSVAYAPTDDLKGRIANVSREGFTTAVDISAYSLIAMSKRAEPLMQQRGGGCIIAMTYLGSERVVPNYNLMGIAKAALEASIRYLAWDLGANNVRVNGISAGPLRTLSARGVGNINAMFDLVEQVAPLRRNIEQKDVGDVAAFLCSDAARNLTGDILYLDAGFHVMGLGSM